MRILLITIPLAIATVFAYQLRPDAEISVDDRAHMNRGESAEEYPAIASPDRSQTSPIPQIPQTQLIEPQSAENFYVQVAAPQASAVSALRESLQHGDPRTPPLASRQERARPSAAELADPDLYRTYEARQRREVYASFVAAAEQKISGLEQLLARARREGVTAAQLAEGENKLARLRAQRDELLRQQPELNKDAKGNQ